MQTEDTQGATLSDMVKRTSAFVHQSICEGSNCYL